MVKRNKNFFNLSENYLFPEVARRVRLYKERHPDADLISLSIGDTSEPLPIVATEGLVNQSSRMSCREGYKGYGAEQGELSLRKKIAEVFYQNRVSEDEIFISDGAKCDIGRLQLLFGSNVSVGVQNPAYPVYVDTSLLTGREEVSYLPCVARRDFFPDVSQIPDVDILYLCSPNNPTGAVASYDQLKQLIDWAKARQAFIIFDAAYSGFIQDPSLPRSIYEVEGGDEVAIEVSSFSKLIGFTGVRAGWCVVPKKLHFENGFSVHKDYQRIITTFFNGASIISQAGAEAALSPQGLKEMKQMLAFYLENAHLIKKALTEKGLPVYGGDNAPYLWVDFGAKNSWDLFQSLLEESQLVTTPGSGFGSAGEGHLRFSAFGSRPHILQAIERIKNRWPTKL